MRQESVDVNIWREAGMSRRPRGVRFSPIAAVDNPGLDRLADEVSSLRGQPMSDIVNWAVSTGEVVSDPGSGQTLQRWASLATIGAVDLEVARVLEPHVDALSIMNQARAADLACANSSWGVYAAEGPNVHLQARRADVAEGGWELSGVKPWCSLASSLTHALITAWVTPQTRGLFAVDLRHHRLHVEPHSWVARGLTRIPSGPIRLNRVPANAVGAPSWYLERDGFAWGGIGVAAIWFGGAVSIFRPLVEQAHQRPPDQIAPYHLGEVDARLTSVKCRLDVRISGQTSRCRIFGRIGGGSGCGAGPISYCRVRRRGLNPRRARFGSRPTDPGARSRQANSRLTGVRAPAPRRTRCCRSGRTDTPGSLMLTPRPVAQPLCTVGILDLVPREEP